MSLKKKLWDWLWVLIIISLVASLLYGLFETFKDTTEKYVKEVAEDRAAQRAETSWELNGINVVIDPDTGRHYLLPHYSFMPPRMKADGTQLCEKLP